LKEAVQQDWWKIEHCAARRMERWEFEVGGKLSRVVELLARQKED